MNGRNPGFFGTFTVSITLALLLSVVSVIFIIAYALYPSLKDQLTFAAAVIGGAAAVYTGYYTAATIRANAAQSKIAASFEFLRQSNQIGYSKIRTKLLTGITWDGSLSDAEIHKKIIQDAELLEVVTNSLGLFEDMSIAVQAEYVDERILFYSIHGTVKWMQEHLDHYIREEKKIRGDSFYCEFDKLANAWNSNKSLRTGIEFTKPKYSSANDVP